jgi:hypothetical protein
LTEDNKLILLFERIDASANFEILII